MVQFRRQRKNCTLLFLSCTAINDAVRQFITTVTFFTIAITIVEAGHETVQQPILHLIEE